MTTQPAAAGLAARTRATPRRRRRTARCRACVKSKVATSITGQFLPLNSTRLAERAVARQRDTARRPGTCAPRARVIMVSPTRPVAPSTATLSTPCSSDDSVCTLARTRRDLSDGPACVATCTSAFCAAVAQVVVHQHERQHRLGDRRGAQAHAGIVPPGGDDLDRFARDVDGAPGTWMLDVGLSVRCTIDVLPGGNAAQHAAGVVAAGSPAGVSSSRCSLPRCAADRDAGADLHGLDRVDAHHGVGDVGIEPVEHRLAQARRHAASRSR